MCLPQGDASVDFLSNFEQIIVSLDEGRNPYLGTKFFSYAPKRKRSTGGSGKMKMFVSISAMSEYCNKSLEELRLEDMTEKPSSSLFENQQLPDISFGAPYSGDNPYLGTRCVGYSPKREHNVRGILQRYEVISSMSQYSNKSFEELRLEDMTRKPSSSLFEHQQPRRITFGYPMDIDDEFEFEWMSSKLFGFRADSEWSGIFGGFPQSMHSPKNSEDGHESKFGTRFPVYVQNKEKNFRGKVLEFVSISAMPQYCQKSFEELRLEDLTQKPSSSMFEECENASDGSETDDEERLLSWLSTDVLKFILSFISLKDVCCFQGVSLEARGASIAAISLVNQVKLTSDNIYAVSKYCMHLSTLDIGVGIGVVIDPFRGPQVPHESFEECRWEHARKTTEQDLFAEILSSNKKTLTKLTLPNGYPSHLQTTASTGPFPRLVEFEAQLDRMQESLLVFLKICGKTLQTLRLTGHHLSLSNAVAPITRHCTSLTEFYSDFPLTSGVQDLRKTFQHLQHLRLYNLHAHHYKEISLFNNLTDLSVMFAHFGRGQLDLSPLATCVAQVETLTLEFRSSFHGWTTKGLPEVGNACAKLRSLVFTTSSSFPEETTKFLGAFSALERLQLSRIWELYDTDERYDDMENLLVQLAETKLANLKSLRVEPRCSSMVGFRTFETIAPHLEELRLDLVLLEDVEYQVELLSRGFPGLETFVLSEETVLNEDMLKILSREHVFPNLELLKFPVWNATPPRMRRYRRPREDLLDSRPFREWKRDLVVRCYDAQYNLM